MLKYAKIINEKTKQCDIGLGTDNEFYKSIGMIEMEVEQAYDNNWYVQGYAPSKPIDIKKQEVRRVRNSYLEQYVDPKQLVLVWETLSEEQQIDYKNYRQYLLNYPESSETWYEQNPLTFEDWKTIQEKTFESIIEETEE